MKEEENLSTKHGENLTQTMQILFLWELFVNFYLGSFLIWYKMRTLMRARISKLSRKRRQMMTSLTTFCPISTTLTSQIPTSKSLTKISSTITLTLGSAFPLIITSQNSSKTLGLLSKIRSQLFLWMRSRILLKLWDTSWSRDPATVKMNSYWENCSRTLISINQDISIWMSCSLWWSDWKLQLTLIIWAQFSPI